MPYSKDAKYRHVRQRKPELFEKGSYRTISILNSPYKGTKFKKEGVLAVVARVKKKYRKDKNKIDWKIQTILVPKGMKL